MANNFEITLDPDAWVPDSTNHPDRGVVQDRTYLAFDPATDEIVVSKAFRMPTAYTGSGTLKAAIGYAMYGASGTGNVYFEVSVEAITDADAVDTEAASSFDTANSSGAITVPGTDGYLDVITITLTNKDSCAAGDMIRLKLSRDATTDTAAGDASVYYVTLYEEA